MNNSLRSCHTRQFVRRTQLVLRPAMRLYFTPAQYLKMSYCDWFLLKKIARQVAVGVSHAATCRVALRKVEAASTFSATCNAIFRCETSCKHGVSHNEVFLAMPLRCKLQGKLPRVTWPLIDGVGFYSAITHSYIFLVLIQIPSATSYFLSCFQRLCADV